MENIYFAPMEGITSYVMRGVHQKYFAGIDKYYMPFISTHPSHVIKGKERRDILPENNVTINKKITIVPQLLTANPQDFAAYVKMLAELGYREVNLNLGCPSGTVVAKGKGAGLLRDDRELDKFLDASFTAIDELHLSDILLSVKTRIGVDDASDAYYIQRILDSYPFSEVIVHPRCRQQMYRGVPDMDAFRVFYENMHLPLIYNGDIFSVEDAKSILQQFPKLKGLMLGRGILRNPALAEEIRGTGHLTPERLREYHDALVDCWMKDQNNGGNVVSRMKELWNYLGGNFVGAEKYLKKLRKTKTLSEYQTIANQILLRKM